jgi:hypothetical protein
MNKEQCNGKTIHIFSKKEENVDVRGIITQNITVVLSAFNEEVSTTRLLPKSYGQF